MQITKEIINLYEFIKLEKSMLKFKLKDKMKENEKKFIK